MTIDYTNILAKLRIDFPNLDIKIDSVFLTVDKIGLGIIPTSNYSVLDYEMQLYEGAYIMVKRFLEKSLEESMLPCPFCKAKGKLREVDEGDYPTPEGLWTPGCEEGHFLDCITSKKEAVAYWNDRK